MSSVYAGTGLEQGAFLGNDGVASGPDPQAIFHTNLEYKPWWQVDLQKEYHLDTIKLYNRQAGGTGER